MADNANIPQAPANARGGGTVGRGGGRGLFRGRTARPTGQTPRSKCGPSRVLDAEWSEESSLKGQTFVVWVGNGTTASRQYTFHHPIGETPLGEHQWVATPTDEVRYLLERRKSEALSRFEREKATAARAVVLAARMGRRLNQADPPQEEWAFDGAPPIAATIRTAMAAAKAASQPESEWVNHAGPAVRAAELQFKQALHNAVPTDEWVAEHPRPVHETRGGPLGDRPQLAIGYLGTNGISAAKDLVLNRMIITGPA